MNVRVEVKVEDGRDCLIAELNEILVEGMDRSKEDRTI